MQKIRDLYKETQYNARNDFNKVTHERMKKILSYCNREINNIYAKNDYTDLDQVDFYREKFQETVDLFDKSIKEGIKKGVLQAKIKQILENDYVPQYQAMTQPQAALPNLLNNQAVAQTSQIKISQPPKNMIQSFFDNKNYEIEKSKVGFKSVLQEIPYAPKKFAVKPSEIKKVGHSYLPDRNQQIKALNQEVQRLKKELASKQKEKSTNMQQIQRQKKQYQDQIKQLNRILAQLQHQNTRLKEGSVKNYPIYDNQPIIVQVQRPPNVKEQEEYKPYFTKFRQNDINKIRNKALPEQKPTYQKSQKSFTEKNLSPYHYQIKPVPQQSSKEPYNLAIIKPLIKQVFDKRQNDSMMQLSRQLSSQSKSKGKDDAQSLAIKSKLSFFKRSMIIYRSQDFEIAVKSSDIIQLELKKIIIYVNNKLNLKKQIKLQYKYDRNYYEIKTTKKMSEIEGLSQGREELEVKLINSNDLDSLVEVRMTMDDNELAFLLPVMFIEFVEKRPSLDGSTTYSSKQINPIHQFAHYQSAAELLPLQKIYGELYETGKVYAISKHHEGYIILRWIGGKVQVETIPQWKLYICYLLLKES